MDASASLLTPSPRADVASTGAASRRTALLRVLGVLAAAVTLYGTFRDVDARALSAMLDGARALLPLTLLPSLLAVVLECAGWQHAFALLGVRASIPALLSVRVASESVGAVLPLGAVWSETAKPPLLARHAGVPLATSIAGIVARKYLLLSAHGAYLVLGFWLGYAALSHACESALGSVWFGTVVLGAAAAVWGWAQLMLVGFRGGPVLETVVKALRVIPIDRLRCTVDRMARSARQSDRETGRFFRARPREIALAVIPCLIGWFLEAFEAWLILRVLGARLDFASVLGVEVFVNLGRQVLVILPSGLGAQELGYATFFATLGVPIETAAAFALLKRAREVFWTMTGLAVLFGPARHEAATAPTT